MEIIAKKAETIKNEEQQRLSLFKMLVGLHLRTNKNSQRVMPES